MYWKFGAIWSRNGRARRILGRWAKGLRGGSLGEGPRLALRVLAGMGLDWGSQALAGLSNRPVDFISCKLQKNGCFLVKIWAIYGHWPKEAAILDWVLLIETGKRTLFDLDLLGSEWEKRENECQLEGRFWENDWTEFNGDCFKRCSKTSSWFLMQTFFSQKLSGFLRGPLGVGRSDFWISASIQVSCFIFCNLVWDYKNKNQNKFWVTGCHGYWEKKFFNKKCIPICYPE